jgi:AcrR family transcriptional regulator
VCVSGTRDRVRLLAELFSLASAVLLPTADCKSEMTAMTNEPTVVTGRRERKRLETRANLVEAALELFTLHGFDAVTVIDIAERADVDPSTFFRNFGSKEAVLFTDVVDSLGSMREGLLERPEAEDLLDSIAAVTMMQATLGKFDPEREMLRAALAESTPTIRAQALVYRDDLAHVLAEAIGERVGLDTAKDMRPNLAASMWVAGFEWYRSLAMSTGKRPKSAQKAIEEIVEQMRPLWPLAGVKREVRKPPASAPAKPAPRTRSTKS